MGIKFHDETLEQTVRQGEEVSVRDRKIEEALLDSEATYRFLTENMHDILWIMDMDLRTLYVTPSVEAILGFTPEERLRQDVSSQLTPPSLALALKVLTEEWAREAQGQGDLKRNVTILLEFYHKDGSTRWLETIVSGIRDDRGVLTRLYGVSRDITKRKQAEDALRESEERVRLLLDSTAEAIYGIDLEGNCTFANPSCLRMLGYTHVNQLLGRNMHEAIHHSYPDGKPMAVEDCRIYRAFRESLDIHADDEVLWKADGTRFPAEYFSHPQISNGRLTGAVVTFLDITQRKKAEEDLRESERRYRELSIVDNLTQLYNVRHFYSQLSMEMERANRYGEPLSLILFDVDNFKAFNDTYGHLEGDKVLTSIGRTVRRCLRKTDSGYRYGGEEFTLLLPMTKSRDGLILAERIRAEFKKISFVPTPGTAVSLTVSLGLAQYRSGEDVKGFVQRVDQLMYEAKRNGKDRVCVEP